MPTEADRKKLQRLKNIRQNAKSELLERIAASRKELSAKILAGADDPHVVTSPAFRDAFYDRVSGHYDAMTAELDAWNKDLVATTGSAFRKQTLLDIKTKTGVEVDTTVVKFDRALVDQYWQLINPDNSASLAGVFTTNMKTTELQMLRTSFVDTQRQAKLSGWTAREQHKALQTAWDAQAQNAASNRFVDAAGRKWNNSRYMDMLITTTTARVGRESGFDAQIDATGSELVKVVNTGESCPICAAWDGVVLSITGANKDHPSYNAALRAGMFHPGCDCLTEAMDDTLDEALLKQQAGTKNPDVKPQTGETEADFKKRAAAAVTDYKAKAAAADAAQKAGTDKAKRDTTATDAKTAAEKAQADEDAWDLKLAQMADEAEAAEKKKAADAAAAKQVKIATAEEIAKADRTAFDDAKAAAATKALAAAHERAQPLADAKADALAQAKAFKTLSKADPKLAVADYKALMADPAAWDTWKQEAGARERALLQAQAQAGRAERHYNELMAADTRARKMDAQVANSPYHTPAEKVRIAAKRQTLHQNATAAGLENAHKGIDKLPDSILLNVTMPTLQDDPTNPRASYNHETDTLLMNPDTNAWSGQHTSFLHEFGHNAHFKTGAATPAAIDADLREAITADLASFSAGAEKQHGKGWKKKYTLTEPAAAGKVRIAFARDSGYATMASLGSDEADYEALHITARKRSSSFYDTLGGMSHKDIGWGHSVTQYQGNYGAMEVYAQCFTAHVEDWPEFDKAFPSTMAYIRKVAPL